MELQFLLILFAVYANASGKNADENAGIPNPNLFQGDIVLTPRQRLALKRGLGLHGGISRGATADRSMLWPYGILPYVIDSTLSSDNDAVTTIDGAMRDWSRYTCITFRKKRETTEGNFVNFVKGKGCWSYVGVINQGMQNITLGRGCYFNYTSGKLYKGSVAHEIAHALGFEHEHSRPDRDKYITINKTNMDKEDEQWFDKYDSSIINSLGVPYDYSSVMHYGTFAFSNNEKPTIVPTQSNVTIGQRIGPSVRDIQQMNRLYRCPCKDKYPLYCPWWKADGYCSRSHWTRINCKRTCELC